MFKKWMKENIHLFVFYFFFATTIYWNTLSSNLSNPDAIWNGMYKVGYEWEASLGRYMIRFWQNLTGGSINAPFITIVCLVEISLICGCVVYVFQIEGIFWQCMAGILLIVSPSFQGTLTYYYCSAYYLLANLLTLISSIVLLRSGTKLKWYYLLSAMVMVCIAMATYQAYIGIIVTVAFIYFIIEILNPELPVKKLAVKMFHLLTGCGGGLLLYLISNKIILKYWGLSLETGRGFAKMGTIQFENLKRTLMECYLNCYQYYFGDRMLNNSYGWIPRKSINFWVCFVIAAAWLLILFKMKQKAGRKLLAIIAFLLLPIAFMCITICAPEVSIFDSTGVLMIPTMNYLYIFLLILRQKCSFLKVRLRDLVCTVSSGLVIIMLGELALDGQTYMKHCMDKTQYVAYEMSHSIMENFSSDSEMRVCIIGKMEDGNFPELYPELRESVHWTTAFHGTIWNNPGAWQKGWIRYMKQFLGVQYQSVSTEEIDIIIASEKYREMAIFPEQGSVQRIGDVVVVKLSEY